MHFDEIFLNRELIRSGDGSVTIYLPELDETYHNRRGALAESEYIYIEKGLKQFSGESEIRILEVGLGTGLNALLSMRHSTQSGQTIHYVSLEPYPLSELEWTQLGYDQIPGIPPGSTDTLHRSEWAVPVWLNRSFSLEKRKEKIEDWLPLPCSFQLIYFDAFAPSRQAEVWTPEILQKMYVSLVSGGFLVCYSAQGAFKRALKACGFSCTHPPGPLGKKEMTIASKA